MPSTYTTNNGIELIGDGEQSGTWGDTTNTNLTLIDTSLDGHATITLVSAGTSGSPNTLPITDGAASNGRNRALIITDGGDLGADVYAQLTPNDAKKILFVRNSLSGSRNLILFQGTYNASNDFVLAAGKDAIVKFDGAGTGAVASALLSDLALDAATLGSATINGNITVTGTVDGRDIAADGTKLDTVETNADVTDTANVTAAGALMDSELTDIAAVKALDQGVATTDSPSFAGLTATTADINGGTIDGTVIGGSTPAAISGTTGTFSGNLTVDTNTLVVDAANNRVGIGTSSPSQKLVVENSATSAFSTIQATNGDGADVRLAARSGGNSSLISANATGSLFFGTNNSEHMRITSTGNVGIGTSSPGELLDVAGDAEINGLTVGRGAGDVGSNTALGFNALTANNTGINNVAVGRQALEANTTGNSNTATGYQALAANTTAGFNSAFGYEALFSNTTGVNDTAIGYEALFSNTTGGNNTAIGHRALLYNTTGGNNTAVGQRAGDVLTTGARNTLLGFACDPSALDGNDQVVVGYNLTGKGNDTAFIGGTGGAYNEKNVTTWETTSDERIKKNIVDNNDGLAVLSKIQVRNFEYRTPDEITDLPSHAAVEQEGVQLGVIAQELQQVLPECVNENSTGVLSVNTDPLIWYLINAVKELKAEIEQLKGE